MPRPAKGQRTPGSGRKKGTTNKLTASVKEAIINAFNRAGGEDYLIKVAETDPKTFLALVGKVVPAEIAGKLSVDVAYKDQSTDDLKRRLEELRGKNAE